MINWEKFARITIEYNGVACECFVDIPAHEEIVDLVLEKAFKNVRMEFQQQLGLGKFDGIIRPSLLSPEMAEVVLNYYKS